MIWHDDDGVVLYIFDTAADGFTSREVYCSQYLEETVPPGAGVLAPQFWIVYALQLVDPIRSAKFGPQHLFGPKRISARSASAKLCHESLGEFHVMVWRSGIGGPSPKSHAHFVVEGCYVQKLTFETVPWDAFFWQKSAIVRVHYEVRRQFYRFYSDFPWFVRCSSVPRGWTGLGGFEAGNGEREVVRPLRVSCRSADSVDRRGVQLWDCAYICVQTCADNIPLHLHLYTFVRSANSKDNLGYTGVTGLVTHTKSGQLHDASSKVVFWKRNGFASLHAAFFIHQKHASIPGLLEILRENWQLFGGFWSQLWPTRCSMAGTTPWSDDKLLREVFSGSDGQMPTLSVIKSEGWVPLRMQALKAKVATWMQKQMEEYGGLELMVLLLESYRLNLYWLWLACTGFCLNFETYRIQSFA